MTAAEAITVAGAVAFWSVWAFAPRRQRRALLPPERTPAQQVADEIERRIDRAVVFGAICWIIGTLAPIAIVAILLRVM